MDPVDEICIECMEEGLSPEECAAREYSRCELHGQPPDQCVEYANIIVQRCKQYDICALCEEQGLSVYECAAREYARCEQQGQPPDQCTEYANIIVEKCKRPETKEPEKTEEKPKEEKPTEEKETESAKPTIPIALLIALGIGGLVILGLLRMYRER